MNVPRERVLAERMARGKPGSTPSFRRQAEVTAETKAGRKLVSVVSTEPKK